MERNPTNPLSRDALTDVLDRGSLDVELARHQEEFPGQFSVLMVDVNDLKPINDSLGHAAGDKLLKDAAQAIESSLRTAEPSEEHEDRELDVISLGRHSADSSHQTGRYGGDEFVVILADVNDAETIGLIVSRVEESLQDYGISAAIGAATHDPEEVATETLQRADKEMYQAKRVYKAELEAARREEAEEAEEKRLEGLPRRKRIAAFGGKVCMKAGNILLAYSSESSQAN